MPTFRVYIRTKEQPANLTVEDFDQFDDAFERSVALMASHEVLSASLTVVLDDRPIAGSDRPPFTSRTGKTYIPR